MTETQTETLRAAVRKAAYAYDRAARAAYTATYALASDADRAGEALRAAVETTRAADRAGEALRDAAEEPPA